MGGEPVRAHTIGQFLRNVSAGRGTICDYRNLVGQDLDHLVTRLALVSVCGIILREFRKHGWQTQRVITSLRDCIFGIGMVVGPDFGDVHKHASQACRSKTKL